jgi:subtilase family serine protease
MSVKRRHARAAGVVGATALLTVTLTQVAHGTSAPRHVITGEQPGWATRAADTGPLAPSTAVRARVYLGGPDSAGLARYAAAVSDPHSRSYEHFLTPAQFGVRYGPTAAQKQSVSRWLAGGGLRVTRTTAHYVAVSGRADDMGTVFGTRLDSYKTPMGTLYAPRSAVSVPASVAPAVLTVIGLSSSTVSPVTGTPPGASAPANEGPCSRYWGQRQAASLPPAYGHELSYSLCGYLPAQLRMAYRVARSGLAGAGATIAIVNPGASPTIASDMNTYARRHGEQRLRRGQLTQYLPAGIARSCAGMAGQPEGYGEESLDAEAAHAMAPSADIAIVAADCGNNATDLLDAETRIVDGHLADIVSNSWDLGTEEQVTRPIVTAYEQVFEQAAAEGIGFYFSSGDRGDWSNFTASHQPAVEYPASDPWVTSVGGTSLATGPDGRYRWETGWGSLVAQLGPGGNAWAGLPGRFRGGAGGGRSSLFGQPPYQRGIVPAALGDPRETGRPARVLPDLAADADLNTGMLIGLTTPLAPDATARYTEMVDGGTSLSAPLIAGIQADAQQAMRGKAIGFADPAIYLRYRTCAYHDVTDHPLGSSLPIASAAADRDPATGIITNRAYTFARDSSLGAVPGYDDVTGVGTPAACYLSSYQKR